MTDLRKAAEMALEACEHLHRTGDTQVFDLCYADKVIPALRQALAQPEQGNSSPNYPISESSTPFVDAVNISAERVDETAKREHEPYGYLWFTHQMERRFTHYRPKEEQRIGEVTPLYTAPPKREWVGLTDEEVESWRGNYDFFDSALVREVEAKLKDKNSG